MRVGDATSQRLLQVVDNRPQILYQSIIYLEAPSHRRLATFPFVRITHNACVDRLIVLIRSTFIITNRTNPYLTCQYSVNVCIWLYISQM